VTYCVAALLKQGLLFASDTRHVNAGVDHVGSFCKMRIYQRQGDRVVVMLSAGNLATTQAMVHLLDNQGLGRHRAPDDLEHDPDVRCRTYR
jgi:putative proteasome-type protease